MLHDKRSHTSEEESIIIQTLYIESEGDLKIGIFSETISFISCVRIVKYCLLT